MIIDGTCKQKHRRAQPTGRCRCRYTHERFGPRMMTTCCQRPGEVHTLGQRAGAFSRIASQNPRHKLTTSTLPAFPLGRTRRPGAALS